MASFGRLTGTTVGAGGISGYDPGSIWSGYSPGDYMDAGKTHRASMDSGFAKLFEGAKGKKATDIKSFQHFMALQNNPKGMINAAVEKHSPDFLLAKMKFAQ